ncbi:MAG TPA: DUF3137 domain-containing protein [Thermoanaerobaculia bacterium]|jgi:hypothetical protein|nr:DUF3137 domain-containing protein [Thermoanaerobaculia bacterium]
MGFFGGVFGPSREEVWKELCARIGADFVEGGFWKGDKVQAQFKHWTITLDTYTVSTGHTHQTFTRMRAPFVSHDELRFRIYRKTAFSDMGKMLGMQDIEVGHSAQFDEDFIIQGNDESKIRALFANPEIRRLIDEQPKIRLELRDDEGFFRKQYPEGVDALYFQVPGIIKDVDRLKQLFDLFAEVLDELQRIGSATEERPGVFL